MPTPLAYVEGSIRTTAMRGCLGVAGVPSPGHAFKWIPCEHRRAPYLSRRWARVQPNPKSTRSLEHEGRSMGSEQPSTQSNLSSRETGDGSYG
jgi:hypothetical protein